MIRGAGTVLLCGLLLAVPWAPGPAAAQTPQADIAVQAPQITGPVPGWTEGVPTDTRFEVTVHNPGDIAASYRIEYSWVQDGMASPLHGDAERSFNVSTTPLPAGAHRSHVEEWRLQVGQEGDGALQVRVLMVSDAGGQPVGEPGHNNAAQTPVRVHTRSVTVAATGPELRIDPDGTGFFRIQVGNQGNGPATVSLRQAAGIDDPRLETLIDPPVVEVPPGQTRQATFYVSFRPSGDFAPFGGHYTVQADPGFGSRPQATSPPVSDAPGGGASGFDASLDVAAGAEWSVPAGQQRTVSLVLANTGTHADNHTFHPALPADWTASVTPERLALYPGEEAPLQVTVTAPPHAAAGADGSVVLLARGSRTMLDPVTLPFRAAGPRPAVEDVVLGAVPYVGDEPRVTVRLANPGDEAVPASVLRLDVQAPGAEAQALETTVAAVAPRAQRTVAFDLDRLTAGGTLTVDATWTPGAATHAASFWVHAPDFSVQAAEPLAGQPGETLAYRIAPHAWSITNTGNAAETVQVAVAARGSAVVEGPSTLVLEPSQIRTVPVLQSLPHHAGQGTDALTFSVSVQGRDRQWTDTVATAIVDREPPRLVPRPLPTLWTVNETLPLGLIVEDASALASARATLTPPDGAPAVVHLASTDDGWTGATVLARPGIHTVSFWATDEAGNAAYTAPHEITAATVAAPTLRIAPPPSHVTAATLLGLQVDDTRPLHRLWLEVRQGDVRLEHPLGVDATGFRVPGDGVQPGPLQVTVKAQNAAGAVGSATVALNWTVAQELEGSPADQESPAPALAVVVALLAGALRRREGRA